MLGTRLLAGLSMAGITLVILVADQWLAPWFPFWLSFVVLAMVVSANELIGLLEATNVAPARNVVYGGILALVVSNWIPHIVGHLLRDERFGLLASSANEPLGSLAWTLVTFVGVVMACFIVQAIQFDRPGHAVASIAGTLFAITYIGLLGGFIVQIRWLDGRGGGLLPLVYLIATAKGSDIGAYLCGRVAGRHKLWPSLSPNKTIEGAIGGLCLSVVASLIVSKIAFALVLPGLEWNAAISYGLLIGVFGQLGDLMESMIKRDCSRKDASSAIPGFGGVLDVLDSLLFAGPAAYAFWLWIGP